MAHRTHTEYESVFMTLMTYSRFRNVKNINMVTLSEFFDDMQSKGITVSDRFKDSFSDAFDRLAEEHHKKIKYKVEQPHLLYNEDEVDDIIEDIFFRLKRRSRRKRHLSIRDINQIESVIMKNRK